MLLSVTLMLLIFVLLFCISIVPSLILQSSLISSLAQSCPTLCDPVDCRTPGFPAHRQLLELTQTHIHHIRYAIQPCHPLLLPPSNFPSITVFWNESVLCIRWPKYWNFTFSISPSKIYSGLISFRIDILDLLAVQGTLKIFLQHHSSKASIFSTQRSL